MKTFREFKEIFNTPAFYILAAVFLALSGYKFYSLLISYTDLLSTYPDYVFGTEAKQLSNIDVNTFLFPKLFELFSYMVVVAVPVLSSGLGNERFYELDKLELTAGGVTELLLIVRKLLFVCSIFIVLFLPTLIYPLFVSIFTPVDWGMLLSSYTGVILLTLTLAVICSPVGLSKINFTVSVFLNLVLAIAMFVYFFEPLFASFWFGIVRLSTMLFVVVLSIAFLFLTKRIYVSTRIF